MDQRKPGPVGTSPVVLSSVVHSVDLGEPCRQKKVCDLSSVTPCSGQWSLRAAAVRAAQGVGSHLAGPAVHAFPPAVTSVQSSHPARACGFLGREGAQLPGQPEVGGQGLRQAAELLQPQGSSTRAG